MSLTSAERLRYSRHLLIPAIGEAGQLRLKGSSVLLIGAGALGSPAAMYLAAAGVGRIGLVDPDEVEISNLQRQIMHGESWIGRPKLESAVARLREINPHIDLRSYAQRFAPDHAIDLARDYDLLVDGSDNFPTRFLTNDCAFFLKKPLVYGAVHRFSGQTAVFAPHLGGPCYRCLLPNLPPPGAVPSCQEAGVLGVLPGIIGSLQAMEAIKLLLGIGEIPLGRLTTYDALTSKFRSLTLRPDPQCRLCGQHPEIHSVSNAETVAPAYCQLPNDMDSITVTELNALMSESFDGLLIDVREPFEHASASIPGAQLIPLASLIDKIPDLPRNCDIYIHCQSGMRSAKAVRMLHERGLTRAKNVVGGINAWLREPQG